ncbi:MAG: hypothetical protein ACI9AR_000606 [Flavobacteriaceae bacterium]|jgi:hypothetical protein
MALSAKATQEFVPIEKIRDGVVVLKDGGLRSVLMCSSVNLSLKSSDEQQAVILNFQTFLNSLDFTTQIVIQSRRLDIRPYISMLEDRLAMQTEPLLKVQIQEYMNFIRQFTEDVNVMKKYFFVVVPYDGTAASNAKGFSLFRSKKKQTDTERFEEKRNQLDQRVGVVQQSLNRVGVRSKQLGTEELIEMYYKVLNPGDIAGVVRVE